MPGSRAGKGTPFSSSQVSENKELRLDFGLARMMRVRRDFLAPMAWVPGVICPHLEAVEAVAKTPWPWRSLTTPHDQPGFYLLKTINELPFPDETTIDYIHRRLSGSNLPSSVAMPTLELLDGGP